MKKIILILSVILLCGCTANYDLKIDADNNYYETLTLTEETSDNADKEYLYSKYLEEYPIYNSEEFMYYSPNEKIEGNTYYNKNFIDENNLYSTIYNATFDNDSYTDSRILVTSFKNRSIGYKASLKYYYIELSDLVIFNADNNINSINISIGVDDNFVVLNNNANNINGNVYTWNFDSSDAKIILRYQTLENYEESKRKENEETQNPNSEITNNSSNNSNNNSEEKNTTMDLILVVCTLICFIFVIIGIVIVSKKVNK